MHERPETHAPEEGVARDARDAAYALGSPREPPLHADARWVGRGEPHHDEEDADKYHRKSHGAQAWELAPQLDDRCVRIGADHPQEADEGGQREHATVGPLAEARHQRVPQPRPRDAGMDQQKESAGEEQREYVNQCYVNTLGEVATRVPPSYFT